MSKKDDVRKGVLFLDVDGVLCTDRAYLAAGQDVNKLKLRTLDPVGIRMVDRLCRDFNLSLVISSTWRHHYNVYDILLTHGFTGKLHDGSGKTQRGANRGGEIRDWLDTHLKNRDQLILILDDCTDGLAGTDLAQYHVVTDYYNGILTDHYQDAVYKLKSQLKSLVLHNKDK